MAKAKKKKKSSTWWFKDYEYDYRTESSTFGGGTRGWMSKLGSNYSSYYGGYSRGSKNEKVDVIRNLLSQLQKSVNLVASNEGEITLKWSDGKKVNGETKNTVYLSPSNLVVDGKISESTVDAMTGKVYLAANLIESLDENCYEKSKELRKSDKTKAIAKTSNYLWEALETSISRKEILDKWAGFDTYINADAKASSASKEKFQEFLDSSVEKPSLEAAIAGISWNLLNQSDKVNIPSCYDACIDVAASHLSDEIAKSKRFDACLKMTTKIAEILGAKDSRPLEMPKVCDSGMFGALVESDLEESEKKLLASEGAPDADKGHKSCSFRLAGKASRAEYLKFVNQSKSAINEIAKSLSFRNTESYMHSFGQLRGEIDENSLHKLRLNDKRVMFLKDTISRKKVAVCLLVDESGSMENHAERGPSRITSAMKVAIVINEALKRVNGVSVSVYGHTANHGEHHGCLVTEYLTPRNPHEESIVKMSALSNNLDGFAIFNSASKFGKDYADCSEKILFSISDGQPAAYDYGGASAMKHINECCLQSKHRFGVKVYGIGIDNAYTVNAGRIMYGEGNFTVLKDVDSSASVMARFIRQICLNMKL